MRSTCIGSGAVESIDASKVGRIARYDGSAATARQERSCRTRSWGRLRFLSIEYLQVNETRAKQPCGASLSAPVSPDLGHDSPRSVLAGATVRQHESCFR